TGQPLTEPLRHRANVDSVQFSPDGERVVTAAQDNTARVWDVHTGQPLTEPLKHSAAVNTAQFSPDGQQVTTASDDMTAQVWETPSVPLPVPSWLPDLAERIARVQVSAEGIVPRTQLSEVLK